MGTEANKIPAERAALLRFLDAAQLPIDRKTIVKQLEQKMPDFACRTLDGEEVAIEVTEMCDGTLPRLQVRAEQGYEQFAYADPNSAEPIVRAKMHKSYATPMPVSLLCYWADRTVSTDEEILDVIRRTVYSSTVPYERVWYHGQDDLHLVYDAS